MRIIWSGPVSSIRRGNRRAVARLTEFGRPVEFLQLPGEGHEFRAATSVLRQLQAMIDFVRRRL